MIGRRLVTSALEDHLAAATGRDVSISIAPTDEDNRVMAQLPFIVIEPGGGEIPSGAPFGDVTGDVHYGFRVVSIGERPDQVEALSDRVMDAIIGRKGSRWMYDLTVSGAFVMFRSMVGPRGRLQREGNIYNITDSYQIDLTADDQ